MGKTSRDKGKRGELEVARLLRNSGFSAARRGQQYHGGGDSPDVVGLPRVHIEVKRVEALNLYSALDQAHADSKLGETPIVLHRRNKKPWVVIMNYWDWLKLYVASGWGTPDVEPGEHRPSYGELFTENCRLRDENNALRKRLDGAADG